MHAYALSRMINTGNEILVVGSLSLDRKINPEFIFQLRDQIQKGSTFLQNTLILCVAHSTECVVIFFTNPSKRNTSLYDIEPDGSHTNTYTHIVLK